MYGKQVCCVLFILVGRKSGSVDTLLNGAYTLHDFNRVLAGSIGGLVRVACLALFSSGTVRTVLRVVYLTALLIGNNGTGGMFNLS